MRSSCPTGRRHSGSSASPRTPSSPGTRPSRLSPRRCRLSPSSRFSTASRRRRWRKGRRRSRLKVRLLWDEVHRGGMSKRGLWREGSENSKIKGWQDVRRSRDTNTLGQALVSLVLASGWDWDA